MRWMLCLVFLVMSGPQDSAQEKLKPAGNSSEEVKGVEVRAVDYAANMQKAIRFLGLGYNLLLADPDAQGHGGVDPGILTQYRVIDTDANGTEAFPRHSCVTRSSTSTIYDEKSFQKKFDLDVKAEASVSTSVVDARFGLSTSFSQARDETSKQRRMSFEQQTLCNMGGARMKTELGLNHASQSFQADVCALPDTYDVNAYARFIDKWGTGVITQLDVGIRQTSTKTESFSSVYKHMMDSLGVGVSASFSYSGVFTSGSGSIEMNMNKLENSDSLKESFRGQETNKSIGTQDFPEPIYVSMASLHTFLTASYFGSSNPSACTSEKLAQLSTKQANLQRALGEYPAHKHAQVAGSDGKVRLPLAWPRGTYGTFKPVNGCPAGWAADGMRYWDTEDDNNINDVTNPHHFTGYINRNIKLYFCVKTIASVNPATDMDWPKGEYCMLQYRDCPAGFESSHIKWDDEDDDNENDASGTLPNGAYYKDTYLYFCCRRDGHNTSPIFLPTDTPFYLLQSERYGCQAVAGMNVHAETINWDCEDSNTKNEASAAAPYRNDYKRNWRLYFCYYYK